MARPTSQSRRREATSASSSTKSTIGDASTPRSDTNRPLSSKPNSASTADISPLGLDVELGSHALDAAFRFTQKRIDHAFFKYRGVAAVQDLLGYLLQSPSMYFKPFSFFLGDAGNNTTMAQT